VCIFPEGHLTGDGDISEFRSGVNRILDRTPVPVIPMSLSGLWKSILSQNCSRKHFVKPFPTVCLNVGEAPDPSDVGPQYLRDTVIRLQREQTR
jgi:1-acyl-sn-glycerol-3-phosphate acyltransferase